jgi:hypothetical protein
MPVAQGKIQFSIREREEIVHDVEVLAERLGLSRSDVYGLAIRSYLEQHGARDGGSRRCLASSTPPRPREETEAH